MRLKGARREGPFGVTSIVATAVGAASAVAVLVSWPLHAEPEDGPMAALTVLEPFTYAGVIVVVASLVGLALAIASLLRREVQTRATFAALVADALLLIVIASYLLSG